VKWRGQAERVGEMINAHTVLIRKTEGRDSFEHVGIHKGIILKTP
jgi:hypothetical protein